MPFSNRTTSFFALLCFLVFRIHHARCTSVKFTSPAAGGTFPAGPMTVSWTDEGSDSSFGTLTTYSLALIVGGNTPNNSKTVATLGGKAPGAKVSDGGLQVEIPEDVGQSIQNGYYLCLTSNTSTGNQLINYSSRFTLIQLNGTTDPTYVTGASSSVGNDNVPTAQQIVISQPISSTASSSPTTPTSTSTAASSPTSTSASNKQFSISGGALAGLAIGTISAVILFLILAVMLLLWWRKRRHTRKGDDGAIQLPDTPSSNWGDKVELSARPTSTLPRSRPAELSPEQERFEVGRRSMPPAELPVGRESVYELESDWSGWEPATGQSHHKAFDPIA